MVYSKLNTLSDQDTCVHVSPHVHIKEGGVKGIEGRQRALGTSLDLCWCLENIYLVSFTVTAAFCFSDDSVLTYLSKKMDSSISSSFRRY